MDELYIAENLGKKRQTGVIKSGGMFIYLPQNDHFTFYYEILNSNILDSLFKRLHNSRYFFSGNVI